jgi:hypothetical protein
MLRDKNDYPCWTFTWNGYHGDVNRVVDQVRTAGESIDAFDAYQLTLLAVVCLRGTTKDVETVLHAGASPDLSIMCDGDWGPSPVFFVFDAMDPGTILPKLQALVAAGADLAGATDRDLNTVWTTASEQLLFGRDEVFAWLETQLGPPPPGVRLDEPLTPSSEFSCGEEED